MTMSEAPTKSTLQRLHELERILRASPIDLTSAKECITAICSAACDCSDEHNQRIGQHAVFTLTERIDYTLRNILMLLENKFEVCPQYVMDRTHELLEREVFFNQLWTGGTQMIRSTLPSHERHLIPMEKWSGMLRFVFTLQVLNPLRRVRGRRVEYLESEVLLDTSTTGELSIWFGPDVVQDVMWSSCVWQVALSVCSPFSRAVTAVPLLRDLLGSSVCASMCGFIPMQLLCCDASAENLAAVATAVIASEGRGVKEAVMVCGWTWYAVYALLSLRTMDFMPLLQLLLRSTDQCDKHNGEITTYVEHVLGVVGGKSKYGTVSENSAYFRDLYIALSPATSRYKSEQQSSCITLFPLAVRLMIGCSIAELLISAGCDTNATDSSQYPYLLNLMWDEFVSFQLCNSCGSCDKVVTLAFILNELEKLCEDQSYFEAVVCLLTTKSKQSGQHLGRILGAYFRRSLSDENSPLSRFLNSLCDDAGLLFKTRVSDFCSMTAC